MIPWIRRIRRGCVRAARTADLKELTIEAIEVRGSEAGDLDVPQGRQDRLVEKAAHRCHGLGREVGRGVCEPLVAQRRKGAMPGRRGSQALGFEDEGRERARCLFPSSLDGPLEVAPALGDGVPADEDAEVPAVFASLAHRTGHQILPRATVAASWGL